MPAEEELKQARAIAYRYLAHRDRSERETAEHLRKKGCCETVVTETIRSLKEAKFLDDRRFAEHWARTRAENRQHGAFRLRHELKGKGIPETVIDQTLDSLFDSVNEIDLARAVVEKKLPSMQDLDPDKRKRRLTGLLQRKGFSTDIIFKVVK